MTAPTTRETADHAELLVLLQAMYETAGGPHAEWDRIDACAAALLSEIAALKGERSFLVEQKEGADDALFDALARATQAERQRDEAVGLLKRWSLTRGEMSGAGTVEGDTNLFLANQGADQ